MVIYDLLKFSFINATNYSFNHEAIHGDMIASFHDYYIESSTRGSVWNYYTQVSSVFNKVVDSYFYNAIVTG